MRYSEFYKTIRNLDIIIKEDYYLIILFYNK